MAQERIGEERMHDVLLLMTHLLKSEEVTLKLILNCLYDVGSVNLINNKLRSRPLSFMALGIARMSKPVFRTVALHWVQKNAPRLATDWLYSKVSFQNVEDQQPDAIAVVSKVQLDSLDTSQQEIKRLRSEVRYLTGISAGALVALASTVIWVSHNPHARTVIHTTNSNGNLATTPSK